MPSAANTSSSPNASALSDRLRSLPTVALRPHPLNANVMPAAWLDKLEANIELQDGEYPPLIVRPHPTERGAFELLDGHQRLEVLRRRGVDTVVCYVWACDDATALRLLATLNRLEGADEPFRRAALLRELNELLPAEDLAALLPEDEQLIADTIGLLDIDGDALAESLRAAEAAARPREHVVSFVIPWDDQAVVDDALRAAMETQQGPNRRGGALVTICRRFLEDADHA